MGAFAITVVSTILAVALLVGGMFSAEIRREYDIKASRKRVAQAA
jgi:hypothetical protein